MAKKEITIVLVLLVVSVVFFFATDEGETNYPKETIYSKVLSKGIVFDDLKKIEVYKGKEKDK